MNIEKVKNRLQILSYIQNSDWFKELENSDLMISKNEKTEVELTEEGKDPNPAPLPGTPLEPDEKRSRHLVDTKVIKPNMDSLLIKPKKKKQLLRIG